MLSSLRALFLLGLFVALAFLLLPASSFAQSGKTVIVKQRDADFVETWVVDFRSALQVLIRYPSFVSNLQHPISNS